MADIKPEWVADMAGLRIVQQKLAEKFDTDKLVKDLPRLMRCPGFNHVKNPNEPFFVTYELLSDYKSSLEDILLALPDEPKPDPPPNKQKKQKQTKTFEEFKLSLPIEEGGRNNALFKLCAEGLGLSIPIDELRNDVTEYCRRSGYAVEDGMALLRRQIKRHENEPFVSFLESAEEFTLEQVARKYLKIEYNKNELENLIIFRNAYFEYDRNRYTSIKPHIIQNRVQRYLQMYGFCQTKNFRNDVLANIDALIQIESEEAAPFFLNGRKNADTYVALKDGLLSIDALKCGEVLLTPHDLNYFNFATLPHQLNPEAKCPVWSSFLEEMIPNEEMRSFLQEWFGYNLFPHNTGQKFVILYGPGANGKSVVCLVLELLLGEENCSHLSLDVFNEVRSFSIAEIEGKLANICSEIDVGSRASESTLKKIVAGDPITAERKFRDPFKIVPTAKLTFATNNIPDFKDRSEGIWRRPVLIPMPMVKLEQDQDIRLVDREFWKSSGELPGILNWALDGIVRFLKNSGFTCTAFTKDLIESHREEANSDIVFLKDHIVEYQGARLYDHELFLVQKVWCDSRGFRPTDVRVLNREIRRLFPSAIRENNPRASNGLRSRFWHGIRILNTVDTTSSLSPPEITTGKIHNSTPAHKSQRDENSRADRAPMVFR